MGLDTTHDAFRGAYSAFNSLRQFVCEAMGGGSSFPPHWIRKPDGTIGDKFPAPRKEGLNDEFWYAGDGYSRETHPGLYEFLSHSDCDGEISAEMCKCVADDLEALLPKAEELNWTSCGHIGGRGGYVEVLRKFIAGCRAAHAAGESLRFH